MFINNLYFCRQTDQMNGALINGLEARVNMIEDKLEDIDARTSEEADNALNEREMDRFIMSGMILLLRLCLVNQRLSILVVTGSVRDVF